LDRLRQVTARLTTPAGPEKPVDDERLSVIERVGKRCADDIRCIDQGDGERAFGERVRSFSRYRLYNSNSYSRGDESARDDPSVAPVVSGAGEYKNSAVEAIAIPKRDLGRRGGSGALHERP
jgi:hypothetical protein